MLALNTNAPALNTQRNLANSGTGLASAIQRLSSGLRINSAKDDAAGLAISERMTTQIRGLDVAVRNANDGISLAQTAEGAMVEIGNNLQRIRELAVQALNDTNSQSDREALDQEAQQLLSEIDRVARQTSFNGTKLLDGSFNGARFQVGANTGQTIALDKLLDAKVPSLGKTQFRRAMMVPPAVANDTDLTIPAFTISNGKNPPVEFKSSTVQSIGAGSATRIEAARLMAEEINARMDETGLVARQMGPGIYLFSIVNGGGDVSVHGLQSVSYAPDPPKTLADVDLGYTSIDPAATRYVLNLSLGVVDTALEQISAARAELGAIQNRFTSTIANLSTTSENLSASRGRILDADYAKETAELTRTQILQQAGTAMLAQANQIPQNVLSLLQ